jgi:hypothetical protein
MSARRRSYRSLIAASLAALVLTIVQVATALAGGIGTDFPK